MSLIGLQPAGWNTARVIALLAIVSSLAAPAIAQYHVDSWTSENGLPQNSVNDIVQTRDGYLWVATHGGLVRFDGVRFTVYDASVEGILSQRVKALHEDRTGTLWAATEDGMLIRYRDGRFSTYTNQDGLPFAGAARIDEDSDGTLWISWKGPVVTKFDGRHFFNFAPGQFPKDVAAPPVERYLDSWWNQDSTGLHVLVRAQVLTYDLRRELAGATVTAVTPDWLGNLWVLTSGAGIIKIADGRVTQYTTDDGLPTGDTDAVVHADHQGGLWFAPRLGGGVYRVKGGRRQWIDSPVPRAFYEDREGSFWIGTVADGLYRVREAGIDLLSERDGVSLKNGYSILQDRTGAIWMGHDTLDRYANGRARSYGSENGLSPVNRVTCLYEDTAGRLWVGTERGLTYFDHDRLEPYEDRSNFLNGGVIAMLEDSTGTLWFATDNGLIARTNGRLTRYTTHDGLSHDRVTALFQSRSGVLWIGTFRGLTRLEKGVFTVYTEQDGFIGNQVRAIHEDRDGVLWVGTYDGGLYRLKNGRLTRYTRSQGLYDNGVFQILEDPESYLWMGSNRGIYRVSRRELNEVADGQRGSVTTLVLGARDGLASVEINGGQQPSGLKAADGRLWFPTMGGLAVINPGDFRVQAHAPPTVIEELRLAGELTSVSGELTIPANISYFDVRYTAPTFVKPDQVKFRYKLIGLDDHWVDAGDRRIATFYRVPPGRYRFVVTASSPEGVWSDDGATLAVVVLPRFWQTWWFAALVFIAAAFMFVGGHQHRVARVRKLHRMQEAFSQRLIDSQEAERRRISSDIHDSLGQHLSIIKKRVRTTEQMPFDQEQLREELDEIAALADRIDVDFNDIAHGLRPQHLEKIGLAKSIEKLIGEARKACDLDFTTDIAPIDDLFAEEPRIHIYRIVQECVSNIVKHSNATRASVAIARHDAFVEICVEDNGQGFSAERLETGAVGRRFGLMGLEERARMLGGTFHVRSAPASGTTVLVRLPLHAATRG